MSVGTRGIPLGTVVVDDAHACLTTATEQFSIRITEESLYDQLLSLFEDDLKGQSASGLLDIKARDPQAVMAVPCGSRTSMGFCCPLTPATGLACTVLAPRASPPPQPAADNERAGCGVTRLFTPKPPYTFTDRQVAVFIGAAERIRTSDPRITNALLYRLSYRGAPAQLPNTHNIQTQATVTARRPRRAA